MAKHKNNFTPRFLDFIVANIKGEADYRISKGENREDVYVDLAIKVMRLAHHGQVLKMGGPYYTHPQYVGDCFSNPLIRQLGYLHDIGEDSNITAGILKRMGFHPDVINGFIACTKLPKELYLDYSERVGKDPLACLIKPVDADHNSWPSREPPKKLTEKRVLHRVDYTLTVPYHNYLNGLRAHRLTKRANELTIAQFMYETDFLTDKPPEEIDLIHKVLLTHSSDPAREFWFNAAMRLAAESGLKLEAPAA